MLSSVFLQAHLSTNTSTTLLLEVGTLDFCQDGHLSSWKINAWARERKMVGVNGKTVCMHGWKSSCWFLVTVVAHLHLASSSILSLTDAFLFKKINKIKVKTCIMCIYVTRSCNGTLSQKSYNVTLLTIIFLFFLWCRNILSLFFLQFPYALFF